MAGRVAADQGEVGGADRGVRAGSDRHAQVGLGEGGGVVDTVTDHRHPDPWSCSARTAADFPVGRHAGEHAGGGNGQLGRHGEGSALVVAGKQHRRAALGGGSVPPPPRCPA